MFMHISIYYIGLYFISPVNQSYSTDECAHHTYGMNCVSKSPKMVYIFYIWRLGSTSKVLCYGEFDCVQGNETSWARMYHMGYHDKVQQFGGQYAYLIPWKLH